MPSTLARVAAVVALFLLVLPSPALANGVAETDSVRVEMFGFPDVVSPGDVITGSLDITNKTLSPFQARVRLVTATVFGPVVLHGYRSHVVVPAGPAANAVRFDYNVRRVGDVPDGEYVLEAQVRVDGEDVVVRHVFTVRREP